MFRKLGYGLAAIGLLAVIIHLLEIRFPTLKWFFAWRESFGWVVCGLLIGGGLALVRFGPRDFQFSPQTQRQIHRFRSIRRGHWSMVILGLLVVLAMLDNLVVGKRALVVSYEGKLLFPAVVDPIPATEFGGEGDGEPNYRDLKDDFAEAGEGNWVLMPPIPWAPTLDSDAEQRAPLTQGAGGLFLLHDEPYSGLASIFYEDDPTVKRQEWRFRRGKKDGPMEGWGPSGEKVEEGIWEEDKRVSHEVLDAASLAEAESA